MTIPVARYYFGFGSTWKTADASITWTEVTSLVLHEGGSQTDRGRGAELDEDRPGTGGFPLDGRNRLFDPSYTGSRAPFTFTAGQLLPGVPVKIVADVTETVLLDENGIPLLAENGEEILLEAPVTTAYPILRGFAEGWAQEYELSDNLPVVPIRVVDGQGRLARVKLQPSPYASVLHSLAPTRWYPLSDRPGATNIVDLGTDGANGTATETGITFGADSLDGVMTAAEFSGGEIALPHDINTRVLEGAGALVIQTTDTTAHILATGHSSAGVRLNAGSIDVSGILLGANPINDGKAHVVVWDQSTDTIWVDGVPLVRSNTVTVTAVVQQPRIGNSPPGSTEGPFVGSLAHIALLPVAPTTATAVALTAALTRWDGDTADVRIGRILDLVEWPTALRDLRTCTTRLGPADTNKAALAVMKDTERTEQGRMFIDRSGKWRLLDRHWGLLSTEGGTSRTTFSDDGVDGPYSGFALDYDARFVFGSAQGSRVDGKTITVSSPGATDIDDTDDSLTALQLRTDSEVRNLLEYRLSRYSEPTLRPRPVVINMNALTAAQQAAVLDLELGHRVTTERTPEALGSAIVTQALVEGIKHSWSADQWTATLTLSPVDLRRFWVWGTDAWGGTETRWGF